MPCSRYSTTGCHPPQPFLEPPQLVFEWLKLQTNWLKTHLKACSILQETSLGNPCTHLSSFFGIWLWNKHWSTYLILAVVLLRELQRPVAETADCSQLLVFLLAEVGQAGVGRLAFKGILQHTENLFKRRKAEEKVNQNRRIPWQGRESKRLLQIATPSVTAFVKPPWASNNVQ